MTGKPRVAIVGPGNFGSALAVALRGVGYTIAAVIARSRGASLTKAQRLGNEVGARALVSPRDLEADLFWFCVPDAAIAGAAQVLAKHNHPRPVSANSAQIRTEHTRSQWKGKVALHSSGALTSDELAALRAFGATVASVHPMMTFVEGSRPILAGVSFAIEGDAAAVRAAGRVVRDLGGHAYSIRKEDKAAYHAWGTFASPLFTALLATTEHVAAAAGQNREAARRRMLPILQQTLTNYGALDAAGAFSGPIVRGDVDTVEKHLGVLRDVPAARDVYIALARAALLYLPAKRKKLLKQILQSPPG